MEWPNSSGNGCERRLRSHQPGRHGSQEPWRLVGAPGRVHPLRGESPLLHPLTMFAIKPVKTYSYQLIRGGCTNRQFCKELPPYGLAPKIPNMKFLDPD